MEKEKKKKTIILVSAALVSILLSVFVLNYFFKPDQTTDYRMRLLVGDKPGMDADSDLITFGRLPPKGAAVRNINLKNNGGQKEAEVMATGNISGWITVSENEFVLERGERKTLKVITRVPSNAEYGKYTGTFRVNFFNK